MAKSKWAIQLLQLNTNHVLVLPFGHCCTANNGISFIIFIP